ncbi:MAG: acetoacetate decarboxylase family protein [Myxococcota bacterium]|nr:acetoacetate decarboxylase family protein [Myxococcota bacterium]
MSEGPKINPGDIILWPMLKLAYETGPGRIAALLPPGIEPSDTSRVHLTVYCFPVPDVPEYGVLINVDADYRGERGFYTLGYGIDQESAVFVSRDRNGQPKYPCEIDYYRMLDGVHARCTHQGYTFLEFDGKATEPLEHPAEHSETEWWIKVSPGVGMAPASTYDFPPHVVRVHTKYGTAFNQKVEGSLTLRDSPWDPIHELLPIESEVSARLWTPSAFERQITLAGKLDPEAFAPCVDTISGSRWPGQNGGPKR